MDKRFMFKDQSMYKLPELNHSVKIIFISLFISFIEMNPTIEKSNAVKIKTHERISIFFLMYGYKEKRII